jgi:hypothetical protein
MVVDLPHCLLIVAQGFQFSSTLFMHFRRASVSQNKSLYSLEFKVAIVSSSAVEGKNTVDSSSCLISMQ